MEDSKRSQMGIAEELKKSVLDFQRPRRPYETLTPRDSRDPSYTNLVIPYRVTCRQRYQRAGYQQRRQFIREIQREELLQTKALDGVRIHREFCDPIIQHVDPGEIIRLTPEEQFRLEEILRRDS